jgi:pyruvate/2-oxoglutarate dehydrogenase complex dihydrolipoamide acyltransferase (E2) component
VVYEFKLPDLGEGLTEGEIARWLVTEGQEVGEDDPLVEIQTDKTTVEIPSPAAGKVARIMVGEGEVVPVGTVLVVIGDDGPAGDGDQPRAGVERQQASLSDTSERGLESVPIKGSDPETKIRATPLVRRLAQQHGVDLGQLEGSGPQARITEDDVRRAASVGGLTPSAAPEGRREPLRGVRRVIAEHMARAHREVPPVTWVEECDFGNVELDRLVATTLKACAAALKEFPELNARLEGDEIVYLDRYDCDSRSPEDLDEEVRRLAEGARAGSLAPEELRGSTFTVTSAGKLAGLFQTPIVNHPEVAILSLGRIAERPVVRDGEIVTRPVGYVALTFDHRVIDGARAAEFGLAVIRRLEAREASSR